MHAQHEESGAAYHAVIGSSLLLMSLIRLACLWSAHAVIDSSKDATGINPAFGSEVSATSPLQLLSALFYLVNGVYMTDIAVTPYMRPGLVAGLDAHGLRSFALKRFLAILLCVFFVLAGTRVALRMYEKRCRAKRGLAEGRV